MMEREQLREQWMKYVKIRQQAGSSEVMKHHSSHLQIHVFTVKATFIQCVSLPGTLCFGVCCMLCPFSSVVNSQNCRKTTNFCFITI